MRTKPILFNFLFVFFLAVSLSFPFQIGLLYEHDMTSWYDWQSIFLKITPLNWLVIAATMVNAYLCFQANPLIKVALPVSIFIVAINNFLVGAWGTDYSLASTWTATLLYTGSGYSLVYGFGLEALEHPEKHWWKIPKRFKKSYPLWIEYGEGKRYLAKTFDLSKTGAFISTLGNDENLPQEIRESLKIGDPLRIIMATKEGELRMNATLVRKEKRALGHYPAGLGINFSAMSIRNSLMLSKLMQAPEYSI